MYVDLTTNINIQVILLNKPLQILNQVILSNKPLQILNQVILSNKSLQILIQVYIMYLKSMGRNRVSISHGQRHPLYFPYGT